MEDELTLRDLAFLTAMAGCWKLPPEGAHVTGWHHLRLHEIGAKKWTVDRGTGSALFEGKRYSLARNAAGNGWHYRITGRDVNLIGDLPDGPKSRRRRAAA
jgi:hypothetical protein